MEYTGGETLGVESLASICKMWVSSNFRREIQISPLCRILGYREGVIDFRLLLEKLGQDFDGVGTLEYLGKYHNHLAQDALRANEFCY